MWSGYVLGLGCDVVNYSDRGGGAIEWNGWMHVIDGSWKSVRSMGYMGVVQGELVEGVKEYWEMVWAEYWNNDVIVWVAFRQLINVRWVVGDALYVFI